MRRASSRPIASPRPKPPAEPGGGAAVEALEDAVALLRRDPGAAVGDRDHARAPRRCAPRPAPARRAGRSAARCRAGSGPRGRPRPGRRAPTTTPRAGSPRSTSSARGRAARTPRRPRARPRRARRARRAAAPRRRAARGRAARPTASTGGRAARRAVLTWRSASSSSICPPRMSSSSSSIVPWSIVSGVRSSCDAVETNARRAASWRRSSSCMRASARARSPTSSRRSSCGIAASGPSSLIRSAAARSRPSRRSSVEERAMASSAAIAGRRRPRSGSGRAPGRRGSRPR